MLDTSVLLSDPRAVFRFDEHEVVIPLVVIIELEAKRTHPELGYFARQALRMLDDFRVDFGRLDERIPLNDEGGTLRVELNHSDLSRLPTGMQLGDNDTRILAVARNLAAEGRDVVVVSKDLPAAGQGLHPGPAGRGVPRRAGRVHRAGPASRRSRSAPRSSTSSTTTSGSTSTSRATCPATPAWC